MNVYFNTNKLADYSVFNNDNYSLSPEKTPNHNIISHFCGNPGIGNSKLQRMSSYIRMYMPYLN